MTVRCCRGHSIDELPSGPLAPCGCPASAAQVRRLLRGGQITPDEAHELGFPPADPIKEKR